MSGCWSLTARVLDGLVRVELELHTFDGAELWIECPTVTPGRPREAALVARLVADASGGAISRGRVLRELRDAA